MGRKSDLSLFGRKCSDRNGLTAWSQAVAGTPRRTASTAGPSALVVRAIRDGTRIVCARRPDPVRGAQDRLCPTADLQVLILKPLLKIGARGYLLKSDARNSLLTAIACVALRARPA
jgi:hypothetical protein